MSIKKVQITAKAAAEEEFERFLRRLPPEDRPSGPPTLKYLLDRYGVSPDELELLDEFGLRHRFSLGSLSALDPDTPIQIAFRRADADYDFPALEPGVLLLKEYLVSEAPENT
ncbi:hypothetical protein OG921_24440 [Aldersonia sp. NBC_00410]|uniref:hypothetical protein n=1 Tax=Aldersonia sp. NBC_00410 TaxID=2975954 RepID=UPI002250532A|nr:hypothetical protein [Aldersonia sp. NBC_00410]MCX5044839.1 hypothetical protein [Aldersonia sp. NBC_00410]MCX5046326.1 hypothetical protein [Aldersonia sp. NBC_00410]